MRHWIKSNLWFSVLLCMTLGFIAPAWGVYLAPYVKVTLMVLIFFGSLDLDFEIILNQLKKPYRTLALMSLIHLGTPALLYPFRDFFSPDIFIGFLVIGASATGMSNIFLSHELRGSPSHALVIVSLTNLAAPFVIPMTMAVYAGAQAQINFLSVITTMMVLIFIPLILARVCVAFGLKEKIKRPAPYLSQLNIGILIYSVIAPLRDDMLNNVKLSLTLLAIVWLITTMNYIIGWTLGENRHAKRTFALGAAFRNFTMAIVVCNEFFTPTAALPAIIYAVVGNFLIVPLQLFAPGRLANSSE